MEDFEETSISSLITVKVRDIRGQGFPEKLSGSANSLFLDFPQPWLAVSSVAKMLKENGVLCSLSPCTEQVQRTCEVHRSYFVEIRTFEVFLRTYKVKELKVDTGSMVGENQDANNERSRPSKRYHRSNENHTNSDDNSYNATSVVVARPCSEARGHTGYLTFARLQCLSYNATVTTRPVDPGSQSYRTSFLTPHRGKKRLHIHR